jgi:hypothetical protein
MNRNSEYPYSVTAKATKRREGFENAGHSREFAYFAVQTIVRNPRGSEADLGASKLAAYVMWSVTG